MASAVSGKGEEFKKMLDKFGEPENINDDLKQAEAEGFNIVER